MPTGRLIEWIDAQLAARNKKATNVAVEARLDRSIVSKWRKGQEAKADDVREFAVALGAPVVDAFLAAGFLTLQDAQVREVDRPLSSVSEEELLAEVRRRTYQVSELIDLWELAIPLSSTDRLDSIDSVELAGAVVKLAGAVTDYAEDLVGGRGRMAELAGARTDAADRLAGQGRIDDLIEQMQEADNAVETTAEPSASLKGGEYEKVSDLSSDRDQSVPDVQQTDGDDQSVTGKADTKAKLSQQHARDALKNPQPAEISEDTLR